jgi:hypothetical protein
VEAFLSLEEYTAMFRPLTQKEGERFAVLASTASDLLRQRAKNNGFDLDVMLESGEVVTGALKQITGDMVTRVLVQPTDTASTGSIGVGNELYNATPAPTMWVRDADLKTLGILRQTRKVVSL